MKKHFYVISLLILFSCQQQKETEETLTPEADQEGREVNSRGEGNDRDTLFLENGNLTQRWYDELLEISKEQDKFTTEKKYQENRHVPGRTDTIITLYTGGQTMLRIHATKGLYAVESAEIRTSDLELQDKVQIGMTKNDLEQILNTNLRADHIQVGNKEQTNVFHFHFKNDKLNRISFQGYVD